MKLTKWIGPLVVALLAPTLGGCFLSTSAGSPGLPATLPRECPKLAKKVPEPKITEGDDILDIAEQYRAAWLKGNHRLGAVYACEEHQADVVDRGAK